MLVANPIHSIPTVAIATVDDDHQMIDLWLHGKSENTVQAYQRDVACFMIYLKGKTLQLVTLNDLQGFHRELLDAGESLTTVNRRMSAVKSLLKFGHRIGVLAVDVGHALQLRTPEDTKSSRILRESEVMRLIHGYRGSDRNRSILEFLYVTGCRVSELVNLTWEQCQSLDDGKARVRIFGKGNKTRWVLLPESVWNQLKTLKGDRPLTDPVFISRKGSQLARSQINRIVQDAAKQAGIDRNVSPHWLRHCHCSHALKGGADINLVASCVGHSRLETTKQYLHVDPSDSSGLHLSGY